MKKLLLGLVVAVTGLTVALAQTPATVESQLQGKTFLQKTDLKSSEIVKRELRGEYTNAQYSLKVEIQSAGKIAGGIEVMVRAWRGTKQLGFGDGTVEIERVRIYNPPILVSDPAGTIVRTWTDARGQVQIRRLREDLVQAVKESVAHTVSLIGKEGTPIEKGKVGRTTSTFYPAAGAVSPVDGFAGRQVVSETFATIRAGAGTRHSETDPGSDACFMSASTTSNQYDFLDKSIFGFDSSAIPDTDTVSSATFSLYGTARDGTLGQSVVIDRRVPADTANLANSDANVAGWSGIEQSSTRITTGSWNTAGYNDFTLDSDGIGNVSKTALSWYGTRCSSDFDNAAPTWGSAQNSYGSAINADTAGTTTDPKLVVVHAASATDTPQILWF